MTKVTSRREVFAPKKRYILSKKTASWLGATLAVGTITSLFDEGKVNATENETEGNVQEIEQQEIDQLPAIESATDETLEVDVQEETTTNETQAEVVTEVEEQAASQVTSVETPAETSAPATQAASMMMSSRTMRTFGTQADFINQIGSLAQVVAAENDLYASIMIAQAILESAWGSSSLAAYPNHNLYGIKGSYQGQSVTMKTWEHINGQDIVINAAFRKYPSFAESLRDNAYVLKTTSFSYGNYFYAGAWKSRTHSYKDATAWLTGRYATDPNYNTKLNNLIASYNLTVYDTPGSGTNVDDNLIISTPNTGNTAVDDSLPVSANGTYQVVSGDTLYRIALKHSMSLAALKTLNGLSSDTIYVGQRLKVSSQQTATPAPTTPAPSTPAPKPVAPNTDTPTSNQQVVVKAGDTLYRIAMQYGTSVSALRSLNHLSSDMIYVGQKLTLAMQEQTSQAPTPEVPKQPTSVAGQTYTVKTGDTLYSLSRKSGVSVASLKRLNALTSDTILVGQRLNLGTATHSTIDQTQTDSTRTTNTYNVKTGDTLYGIAKQTGVSVANLKAWNDLSSDNIQVGQKLTIKGGTMPTNKPTTATNTTKQSYTVVSGDTLYGVARKNGIAVSQLKSWNNLASDLIFIGQQLKVSDKTTTTKAPAVVAQATTNAKSYTVKSGDTLFKIASTYNVSMAQLKAWNSLASDIIYVGQKLKIVSATDVSKVEQTPSEIDSNGKYTIKPGDTLYSIANKFKMSVADLRTANNLRNHIIHVGQRLNVKDNASQENVDAQTTYQVKAKDTLWQVSSKTHVSVSTLKSLNHLTSDTIYVGQMLKLK